MSNLKRYYWKIEWDIWIGTPNLQNEPNFQGLEKMQFFLTHNGETLEPNSFHHCFFMVSLFLCSSYYCSCFVIRHVELASTSRMKKIMEKKKRSLVIKAEVFFLMIFFFLLLSFTQQTLGSKPSSRFNSFGNLKSKQYNKMCHCPLNVFTGFWMNSLVPLN
jgi:hypothetical protein